ncbi:MAG: hypothetical protein AAGJ46_19435 [Planctomycetota bacterium]
MPRSKSDRQTKVKVTKVHREHYRLGVNSYDRASSLLVSLLVMVGVAVLALLIIFFARRFVGTTVPPVIKPRDPAERPADAAMGFKEDIEPPGLEDAPELLEPKLMDTLNALTSKLSSKVAILSDDNLDADNAPGKGTGMGDRRTSGGGSGAPEPMRIIEYEFADEATYARWYDFYKIELAVATATSPTVWYASNLSAAKPTVRQGPRSEDQRYLFPANEGALYSFDLGFARTAGIADKGNFVFQCYPEAAENLLLGREQQQARSAGKPLDQIQQTTFSVKSTRSGFDITVKEQLYY